MPVTVAGLATVVLGPKFMEEVLEGVGLLKVDRRAKNW